MIRLGSQKCGLREQHVISSAAEEFDRLRTSKVMHTKPARTCTTFLAKLGLHPSDRARARASLRGLFDVGSVAADGRVKGAD